MRSGLAALAALFAADVAHAASNGISLRMKRLETTHEEMYLQSLREVDAEASLHAYAVKTDLLLGQGVHSVEVFFGGQRRVLIVDTGSADTAFPCAKCNECGVDHMNPFYATTDDSQYVTCAENAELGFSACKKCTTDHRCSFAESYVEGSGWEAFKVRDKCHFATDPSVAADVVFGCMYTESGAFLDQRADGIMGMSQDLDAIFLQFFKSGATSMQGFSQCISKTGGTMAIGGLDPSVHKPGAEMQFTPLRRTGYTYWTVFLESVSVDGRVVDVDQSVYNAHRGCVLDSGTTYVYLPSAVLPAFQTQWEAAVLAADLSSRFETYTEGAQYYIPTRAQLAQLPTIAFNFTNNATMFLPPEQYMVPVDEYSGEYMATIFFEDFAHATILGASMLENHNVLYDMGNSRVGFAPADCDSAAAATSSSALITDVGGDKFTPEFSWLEFCLSSPSASGFFLGMLALFVAKEVVAAVSTTRKGEKGSAMDDDNDSGGDTSFRLHVSE
ncbi:Aste57867_951 [Aphanomyces stellatus]|uniref:Aste57867_951 protein n=1 Tax=Aphanomyces stellatus TaxID=120398 RepID=A0A485K478_9STRA|nr:hypothetical protein As57867_000950 [Aphanomyces stellatus]VFT78174.1 Aste57867_951 [Aphanomyces stellatus]